MKANGCRLRTGRAGCAGEGNGFSRHCRALLLYVKQSATITAIAVVLCRTKSPFTGGGFLHAVKHDARILRSGGLLMEAQMRARWHRDIFVLWLYIHKHGSECLQLSDLSLERLLWEGPTKFNPFEPLLRV